MRKSCLYFRFCIIGSTLGLVPLGSAAAQQDYGTQQTVLQPGITTRPKLQGMVCPNGGYLSGLALKLTDRVTGLFLRCQSATWTGLWTAEQPISMRVAGDATPYDVEANCPPNHFITGLGYVTGNYLAGGIAANPESGELIADLRPVCRLQRGAPFLLNRHPLTGAEDNGLHEVPWQEGNRQNCPRGSAAVGVAISFIYRRDLDPNNRFYDVALYCRRLSVGLRPGVDSL